MGINKKHVLFTIMTLVYSVISFTLFTVSVYAAGPIVRITEILYNAEGLDEGKEYVEVINIGPGQIDMTTVKFFERSSNGHAIRQHGTKNAVLQPGDIAVIVESPKLFLHNYPSFDGTLLDTGSFALLNAGATVSLEQDGRLLHSITYSKQNGAQGDGNALHIAEDDTISAEYPSVGVVNGITINTSVSDVNAITNTDNAVPSTETNTTHDETANGVTFISDPAIVFSASTTKFSVVRKEDDEEQKVLYGSWNFGDGTYVLGDITEHSYLHPGAYIVVFQEHVESGKGVALQQEVRALFPQVIVKRTDEAFVRLHNHHSFMLDVSGWQIISGVSTFVFPENSLVSSKDGVTIPFAVDPESRLFFITAGGGQFSGENKLFSGETDTTTKASTQKENTQGNSIARGNTPASNKRTTIKTDAEKNNAQPKTANIYRSSSAPNDDSSDTANADSSAESSNKLKMVVIWIALLLGVIVLALVPLFFSRAEKKKHKNIKF